MLPSTRQLRADTLVLPGVIQIPMRPQRVTRLLRMTWLFAPLTTLMPVSWHWSTRLPSTRAGAAPPMSMPFPLVVTTLLRTTTCEELLT